MGGMETNRGVVFSVCWGREGQAVQNAANSRGTRARCFCGHIPGVQSYLEGYFTEARCIHEANIDR